MIFQNRLVNELYHNTSVQIMLYLHENRQVAWEIPVSMTNKKVMMRQVVRIG